MSVAIEATATAQFNKDAYDAEFDLVPTVESDDELGPAKMCFITCLITGL